MSVPGLEVMATVEMVGAVLCACATNTVVKSAAIRTAAGRNLIKGYFSPSTFASL